MTAEQPTAFGELLRRYRHAASLTQSELAERAGLSWRGINDLERGVRRQPRRDTIVRLADALALAAAERAAFFAAAHPPAAGAALTSATAPTGRTLPAGTVTLLFSDIEGSTRLLQQQGSERYAALRAEHQALLRAALVAHRGHEIDSQGDSFFVAFATAEAAVLAAATAQRALAAHPWPAEGAVRVRIGLHTGTPQLAGDRYVGLDVHRAARIAAAGHGGQVLLSEATGALVVSTLPEGLTLRDLGPHRLKDLRQPERIFQLVVPDLPSEFPSLNALNSHRHNLPVQLTSFVGRERELAELQPLLRESRLLTLTGPGGTGKTRLALRLAANAVESFPDGAWLVELAPLADPALVPHTVAAALGAREQPGGAMLDAVLDYLRAKSLLLLLDNCEHLIAACARVAEAILRAAPGVRILASSSEALGVAGETVYRVPSLALPEPEAPTGLEALAANDCVRLFAARAAAAQPAFHLTATNAPIVAQIGRRLDGIPLAIELAAARTRVFPPEQIASRLDDRFHLLTGGSRTALPRHQTLQALMEWSYLLLTQPEQALLRRLSVFAGSWTLESAQAVCDEGLGADVLETLAQLVEKSLVEPEAHSDKSEGRFRLLETIRQYASDRLREAGEAELIRDRHLACYLHFAEEAEPMLRSREQLAWLGRVEAEMDNVRAALAWALESGNSASALELAGALTYSWLLQNHFSEMLKWLEDALALSEREQRSKAEAGPYTLTRAEQARRAKALAATAMPYMLTLGLERARAAVEESLRLWRELGDKWFIAATSEPMALILSSLGDFQAARACLEEGVAVARTIEDPWPLAACLVRMGDVLRPVGEMAEARRHLEEGVAVARGVGDGVVLSEGLRELGTAYYGEGNLPAAMNAIEEALALSRAIGSLLQAQLALIHLVVIAGLQKDLAQARRYCLESWAVYLETGSYFTMLFPLTTFGLVESLGEHPERGVRLLAAAVVAIRQAGLDLDREDQDTVTLFYKQTQEQARTRLGQAAFEAATRAGRAMTQDETLILATEVALAFAEQARAIV